MDFIQHKRTETASFVGKVYKILLIQIGRLNQVANNHHPTFSNDCWSRFFIGESVPLLCDQTV